MTYQLQVSRLLNQYEIEDHQYLTGLPAGTSSANGCAVLVRRVPVGPEQDRTAPQHTTDSFDIVDTQGNRYYPVALNPSVNQYAWASETLAPRADPARARLDGGAGLTGGALVLFKLSTQVYANRPLTLEIHQPGQLEALDDLARPLRSDEAPPAHPGGSSHLHPPGRAGGGVPAGRLDRLGPRERGGCGQAGPASRSQSPRGTCGAVPSPWPGRTATTYWLRRSPSPAPVTPPSASGCSTRTSRRYPGE